MDSGWFNCHLNLGTIIIRRERVHDSYVPGIDVFGSVMVYQVNAVLSLHVTFSYMIFSDVLIDHRGILKMLLTCLFTCVMRIKYQTVPLILNRDLRDT